MKYCVEISEEQLRIISVAVDEYMRLRMGQFEPLTEDLVFDGEDKKQLYEKPYDIRVYNERKHCIETMFEAAYKLAYPPFGHRERQHDSWGTCIDLVHAIEHQQWLDSSCCGTSRRHPPCAPCPIHQAAEQAPDGRHSRHR